MCDRDFRFLEFQKFKASWVLFNHDEEVRWQKAQVLG